MMGESRVRVEDGVENPASSSITNLEVPMIQQDELPLYGPPLPAMGPQHADEESTDSPLALWRPNRAVPIHPNTSLLDPLFWDVVARRQAEQHARVAVARLEVQSYESMVGQSTREDYHRTYGDLNGMEPIFDESWTNSYTDYKSLSFRLNHVYDENEGLTMVKRVPKVVAFEPYTVDVWVHTSLATSQACLVAIAESFRWCTGQPARIAPIPEWRTSLGADGKRTCFRVRKVTKQRPSEEVWVEVESPLQKSWVNPYQIEDGMVMLKTSQGRHFGEEGTEGISILRDRNDRMHLVHWVTRYQRHWAKGRRGFYWADRSRRPSKIPLTVRSFSIDPGPTEEEALQEMKSVASAMERSARYVGTLLPWQAAEMADLDVPDSESVSAISGSLEWLQRVADQGETHETYRPRGAMSDD